MPWPSPPEQTQIQDIFEELGAFEVRDPKLPKHPVVLPLNRLAAVDKDDDTLDGDEIVALYKAGYGAKAIAQKLHTTQNSVYSKLYAAKMQLRSTFQQKMLDKAKPSDEELTYKYERMSIRKLLRHYGVSERLLIKWLDDLGIKPKRGRRLCHD